MTIKIADDGRIIHFPNNPDRFEFDSEVSEHCQDFFSRAIPLYHETQDIISKLMFRRIQEIWSVEDRAVQLVDIGASRGSLLKKLWGLCGVPTSQLVPRLSVVAVDNSPHMISRLATEMPGVLCICEDALNIDSVCLAESLGSQDIVAVSYLVQFLRPDDQSLFWERLYSVVREGAYIFVSGKERMGRDVEKTLADSLYNQFRLDQGYSQDEIDSKTRALESTMWPPTRDKLIRDMIRHGFMLEMDLTRYANFASYLITKQ